MPTLPVDSTHCAASARVRHLHSLNKEPLPNMFDVHPEARSAFRRELGLATIRVEEIWGTAVEGPGPRGRVERVCLLRDGRKEPTGGPRRRVAMHATRRAHVIVLAASLLAVALGASACASGTPVPLRVATGALVTVETRGGLCADGPCGTTIVIERNGRVHQAAKPPNDLGIVPPAALAALDVAIGTTDFTALRSHRFTGQCPTAFDGHEIVFEFGAPGGVQRIATCEVDVDFGAPLFLAVSTALGPFVSLPTP
jgi:hypothetical protein